MEAEVLLVIQSKVLLITNQFDVEQPCEIQLQDLMAVMIVRKVHK